MFYPLRFPCGFKQRVSELGGGGVGGMYGSKPGSLNRKTHADDTSNCCCVTPRSNIALFISILQDSLRYFSARFSFLFVYKER